MVVAAIDEQVDGTTLTVRVDDVDRPIHLDAVADTKAARRWQLACRRVDRIEMTLGGDHVRFVLCATGHRLPIQRRITAATALGLASLGYPVIVTEERLMVICHCEAINDAAVRSILDDATTSISDIVENWGWQRLAHKYREESTEEIRDAEKLMARILLLDGVPNLQRLGSVHVGETVLEQLELDAALEVDAVDRCRRGVALSLEHGDPGTRELLEHLVVGEEHHLDWIETRQRIIADIGIGRYLQSQLHD